MSNKMANAMMNKDEVIKNRYNFSFFIEVVYGNINGDPETDGTPRMDPCTGYGEVTDVCIKRHIRNCVDAMKENAPGYKIYIQNRVPLNVLDREAYISLGAEEDDDEKTQLEKMKKLKKSDSDVDIKLKDFMCKNYYDTRTFGGVMTTFKKDQLGNGQISGPVQIGMGRSIDVIDSRDMAITRMAVSKEEDAKENKTSAFGRKGVVPYAIYRVDGSVSPTLAKKTGFTEDDLQILWDSIINLFEFDRSATRANISVREFIVFKHKDALGNCPAYKLREAIEVHKKDDVIYPRKFQDYVFEIHEDQIPEDVEVIRMI